MLIVTLLIFLLIFSFVVLVHEGGHFIAAKLIGVRVEEFGWGFPPKLWAKKIKGTLYSINLLPIGGFVKLYGEEFDAPVKDTDSFWHHRPRHKALVLVGGVVANLLLGVGLYYLILASHGFVSAPIFLFKDYTFPFGTTSVSSTLIVNVVAGSPGAVAGLIPGDLITAVNGRPVATAELLNDSVAGKAGQTQVLLVRNITTGVVRTVNATPYYDETFHKTRFGLELVKVAFISYLSPLEKTLAGFGQSANVLIYSVKTLGDLFSLSAQSGSTAPITEQVTGPVGIAGIVGTVIKTSGPQLLNNLLELMALLSLALGFTNILPIPAMDGGHLAFVAYEVVFRRKPNKRFQEAVNRYGFYVLIVLSLLIAFKDFRNLIK